MRASSATCALFRLIGTWIDLGLLLKQVETLFAMHKVMALSRRGSCIPHGRGHDLLDDGVALGRVARGIKAPHSVSLQAPDCRPPFQQFLRSIPLAIALQLPVRSQGCGAARGFLRLPVSGFHRPGYRGTWSSVCCLQWSFLPVPRRFPCNAFARPRWPPLAYHSRRCRLSVVQVPVTTLSSPVFFLFRSSVRQSRTAFH